MLKLYKDTNIYILAPANVATGGVELLHQLAFKINSVLGFENVFIKYVGEKKGLNPTPKDYDKYNIKYVSEVKDVESNILVVPEIYTKELFKFKKIRRVVRWLSVDNYYFSGGVNLFFRHINYRILLKIFGIQNYLGFSGKLREIDTHLVQCEYVKQHLLLKGIERNSIEYLSDYLIADFFDNKWDIKDKQDIVCYNPKKGFKYTKKLIKYMRQDNVKFVPIQNMSRQEVIDLLKKSKIYIDFGHFPGKDRIPREASILGCIILISKMGAGKYYQDFPINERYKIDDLTDKEKIRKFILSYMEDYSILKDDFKSYNKFLFGEENKFDEDLKKIFKICG